MDSGTWRKVKSLFFKASDMDAAERSEFLRQIESADQGVDTEVRKEVREMLQNQAEAGSFLGEPVFPRSAGPAADDTRDFRAVDLQFGPGDLIADRYRVTRYIARGGMGEVYEAEDLELGILIAVKAIRPNVISNEDLLLRFKREIDLARRVTHPNIGRIYDFGRHRVVGAGEIPFLTMELLLGETLAERIRRAGPIPPAEALEIVRDIVAALDAIHKCGIVHRDFKSSNVMLIEHNHKVAARVMDFGLARPTIGDGTLTQTGQIGGTPPYMAPEQFENVATPATDIYALGIVMHEMLLGVRPRSAGMEKSTAKLAQLPANWAAAIRRCIELDPKDRFASAYDLLRAIEEPAVAVAAGSRVDVKRKSLRAVWIMAALVFLAIAGATTWWLVRDVTGVHASPKRIAILPIHTESKDPLDAAFCEGLSNTLRSDLAELEPSEQALWVIPSSEVRDVRTASAAHRQTGANLVVDASFSRTSSGLSLNTELVDANTNRVLSSRQLQAVDSGELRAQEFPLLAGMLGLQVASQASKQIAESGTKEPGAFDYYEQGLGYLGRTDVIDFDMAIDLFGRSLSRDPKFALAYAGLGDAYARKYRATEDPQWIQKARENGAKAVSLNGNIAQVHLTMADIDSLTGQDADAIREARRSLEIEPGCTSCLFILGWVYANQGRLDDAAKAFQSILALRSGEWIGYGGLAWVEQKRGNLAGSAALFKKVVELVPDNAHVLADLGGVYLGMGQWDAAIGVLRKAIQIRPQDEAFSNLGAALMYERRFSEAPEFMEKAVQLAPEKHDNWRNLGDSYRQVPAQSGRAAAAYKTALEKAEAQLAIRQGDASLESSMGLYYAHLGDAQRARRFTGAAVKKSPGDADVLFAAAIASELLRDRPSALKYLDAAWKAGFSLMFIDNEPELFALHGDARYQSWIEKARKGTKV